MLRNKLALVCVTLLIMCGGSLPARDEGENKESSRELSEPVATDEALRSVEVVVRDVAYVLEQSAGKLRLISQRVRGDVSAVLQEDVKLRLTDGQDIVELALAPLSKKHLVAVVKTRSAERFDYYCLTFTWMREDGAALDSRRPWVGLFLSVREDLKVLGLSGHHGAGSVVAILGRFEGNDAEDGGVYVNEGKIPGA